MAGESGLASAVAGGRRCADSELESLVARQNPSLKCIGNSYVLSRKARLNVHSSIYVSAPRGADNTDARRTWKDKLTLPACCCLNLTQAYTDSIVRTPNPGP